MTQWNTLKDSLDRYGSEKDNHIPQKGLWLGGSWLMPQSK